MRINNQEHLLNIQNVTTLNIYDQTIKQQVQSGAVDETTGLCYCSVADCLQSFKSENTQPNVDELCTFYYNVKIKLSTLTKIS